MGFSFFKAKKQEADYVISGMKSCFLGHKFVAKGQASPQGIFAQWEWKDGELSACVDLLGFYNLFYYATNEEVIVSPSPIQLIAEGAPSELDEQALGVFFRIGFFIEEDTPFKKIKVLPPGGKLVWKAGVISVSGGMEIQPESRVSRREAVDGFIDLFRQSVRQSLESCHGEIVLPLSGGRDSRHILFELKRAGIMPSRCITYNGNTAKDPDAEVLAAMQVSQAVGVPHVILSDKQSRFRDQIITLLKTHLCSDEHFQHMPLQDYCRSVDCILLDGIGGDVLSRNGNFTNVALYDFSRKDQWKQMSRIVIQDFIKVTGFRLEDLIGEQQTQASFPQEQAVEYLQKTLEKFEGAADPWTSFLFWNRTRREIALNLTGMLANARCVLAPYLAHNLVSFLASLSFEVISNPRFHDEVIATAFPEYAHIPYHNELKVKKRQRSAWQRLKTMREGILAVAKVNQKLLLPEVKAQLEMAINAKRTATNVYRYYLICLNEVCNKESVKRFIEVVSEMKTS